MNKIESTKVSAFQALKASVVASLPPFLGNKLSSDAAALKLIPKQGGG